MTLVPHPKDDAPRTYVKHVRRARIKVKEAPKQILPLDVPPTSNGSFSGGPLHRSAAFHASRLVWFILTKKQFNLMATSVNELLDLMPHSQGYRNLMAHALSQLGGGVRTLDTLTDVDRTAVSSIQEISDLQPDFQPTLTEMAEHIEALRNIRERNQLHRSLAAAMDALESGQYDKEKAALDSLKKSVNTTDFDRSRVEEEGITIPGPLPENVKMVDRSNTDWSGTVFESWTRLVEGELGFILGGPKAGKTTALVDIGAGYIENDERALVIHFSEEIKAASVYGKYMRRLSGTENWDNMEFEVEGHGKLYVESHPSGTSTAAYLERRVEKIRAKFPTMKLVAVIVDYMGIMRGNGDSRFDTLSGIGIDLRAMAERQKTRVWTACQPQRAPQREVHKGFGLATRLKQMGHALPVLGLEDVGECWAIPHVADVLVSLNQTADEAERPVPAIRVHAAAVREPYFPENQKKPARTVEVGVDYALCRFI